MDALTETVKSRARSFVEDNRRFFPRPIGYCLLIETAMLIGASIATEIQVKTEIQSTPTDEAFKDWLKEYHRTTSRSASVIGKSRGWLTIQDDVTRYRWKWQRARMIEATHRLRKRVSFC